MEQVAGIALVLAGILAATQSSTAASRCSRSRTCYLPRATTYRPWPERASDEKVPMTTTAELQRRTLRVLVVAQVLSGAGLAAGITVGALLAQDMLGSTGLAGLPSALFTAGSALAAIAVGRLSQSPRTPPRSRHRLRRGRASGSFGVVVAAALDSPALLFVTLFVYGAGSATNLQARYAGADLADPGHRARAISTVLVATTLGGVVGPLLAAPTGHLAHLVGVPHLAGPFLLAGAAYVAAAAFLAMRLRPDPLLHARELAASRGRGHRGGARSGARSRADG